MASSCLLEVIDSQRTYAVFIEADLLLIADQADAHVRAAVAAPLTIQLDHAQGPKLEAPEGVAINGVVQLRAHLQAGDQLALTPEQSLIFAGIDTGIFQFRLQGAYRPPSAQEGGPGRTTGQRKGAFFGLLLVFLLSLLSLPFWVPNFATQLPAALDREQGSRAVQSGLALEQWLSSGPLHAAHQTVTTGCADCHVEGTSTLPNEPCFACHTMERHFSREKTADHPLCVTCHKEHNEPNNLINGDGRLCSQCHNDMNAVRAVLTAGTTHNLKPFMHFDGAHPEFDPVLAPANFNFNHQAHLQKDLVAGEPALQCASCHEPNGAAFTPVQFAAHCADCHKLSREGKTEPWIHGNLAAVVMQFQAENDGPLDAALSLTNGETCQQCHRVKLTSLDPGSLQSASERWRLAFPSLNARFSHKRHEGRLACADCHNAAHSEQAEDVLLPSRAQCQSCHNQTAPQPLQECATCHRFHRVSWE